MRTGRSEHRTIWLSTHNVTDKNVASPWSIETLHELSTFIPDFCSNKIQSSYFLLPKGFFMIKDKKKKVFFFLFYFISTSHLPFLGSSQCHLPMACAESCNPAGHPLGWCTTASDTVSNKHTNTSTHTHKHMKTNIVNAEVWETEQVTCHVK